MSPSLSRPRARRDSATVAAESWFLERGLPAVLTTRGRWRRLWPRSAPMLAAYATTDSCGLAIYLISGGKEVEINGTPTTAEWVLLAIVLLALPLAALVGWLVSRLSTSRARTVAGILAVAVMALVAAIERDKAHVPEIAVAVVVLMILTGCGVGAVLGWAVRMMLSHLATVGALAVRALPVVLLTALVFFNTYVWLMAATISRNRLWLALLFLVSIATAFVVSGTLERVRPMLRSTTALPEDSERLADTPFARMPDASPGAPLTKVERLNVVFVVAASQLIQILVVAAVTATIFFILGLIVLSPELLDAWTHHGRSDGTVLNMTLPVPQSLIHISLFLAAMTFMYISARAVGDAGYRSTFFDPLIDDLHATLVARNRYRGSLGRGARVDAAEASD